MKTPRFIKFLFAPAFLVVFVACKDNAAKMAKGFRLPEGDIERGKVAFMQLECHQCHPVAGLDLPQPETPSPVSCELGGVVRKVKTYGELVTAIIQPQHIVSPEYLEKLGVTEGGTAASPMPAFNDTMTVTQMTDIVTFLHAHYQKAPPPNVNYPYYAP